ncbi:reverse transcriptase domain-containing protein [Tanacetum coccineum]
MLKWKFELEGYDIHYRPRTSIKGQILADFIVERPEEESPDEPMTEPEEILEPWIILRRIIFVLFEATNNEVEYEALIAGLRIAEQMGIKLMAPTTRKQMALSKIASTSFAHLSKQVLVEELKEKSINEKEILAVVEEEGNTWMTPICEYLTKEILPADKKKARAIRRKAVSMHSGPRSVVAKAIRTGYYWPTMHMDARKLIRECNDCQVHRPVPRNPQQNLSPITSPWPFYKWGIDIAGPFPEGPGKVKFLIVVVDYFTKWIEAKPVATITGNQVKKFVWDNIVCRFGLPGEIVSDNGKQFRDNPFKDWCEKLCIHQCFAS